jgi:choline dehydrogenase-like flavoprotein
MPIVSTPVREGRRHAGDLDIDADAVVIGSGASGAVVAAILAEAGERVVILEEGPHVPVAEIQKMRPSQHLRRAWRDGGMTVAVGVGGSPTINVTMGRAVGGSSIVTGGVCFRTPEHVLHEWSHRLELADYTSERLAPYFDEVERAISVEEVPESMRSLSTRRFAEGAQKIGLTIEPLRRNTRGCNGCGRCNFGCPHGAKLSVDMTYLPRAVAAGATIFSDCLVDQIVVEVRPRGRGEGKDPRARRRLLVAPGADLGARAPGRGGGRRLPHAPAARAQRGRSPLGAGRAQHDAAPGVPHVRPLRGAHRRLEGGAAERVHPHPSRPRGSR